MTGSLLLHISEHLYEMHGEKACCYKVANDSKL